MFPVLSESDKPVLIEDAVRGVTYKCPECVKAGRASKVMVRDGRSRRKHFAHHSNSNCAYTSGGGGEGSTHLAAKLSLVDYLSRGNSLQFTRQCNLCKKEHQHQIQIKEGEMVKSEYRMTYEGKTIIPDIAILTSGSLIRKTIIEVCHTHAQRNRPEPWYEFDASALLSTFIGEKESLSDLRSTLCDACRPPSDVGISCTSCRSPTAPSLLNSVNVCLRCRISSNKRTPYARPRH